MHKYKQSNLLHFLFHVPTNHTSFNHHKSLLSSHFLLIVMFKCKMNCCKSMGANFERQIETVPHNKTKLFTLLHANHTLVRTPLLCICTNISKVICYISCFMFPPILRALIITNHFQALICCLEQSSSTK